MGRRCLLVNPPVLTVDAYQVNLYAEAIPFGLLQIASHLLEAGHEVDLVDMMEYRGRDFERALVPERLWGTKRVGGVGVETRPRDVFLYGRSLAWLEERLAGLAAPDEVLVTCCLSFNYEPAHAVIALCRKRFPRARIRFGGAYPSLLPDHARASGADEVYVGRYREAEDCSPRPDLLEATPACWLFRLVLGCRYRCSFCVNASEGSEGVGDARRVADGILEIRETHGIRRFSNWDPNVILAPDVLEGFLDAMVAAGAPVELGFEMGIQPDRLTPRLAEKMRLAGVRKMTIAFESAEASTMRRLGKPYRMQHAMDAVAMCREMGFDTTRFHCPYIIGLAGESFRHLFRTYFGVLKAGGLPTPFPLSPTPGTREHRRHQDRLEGKDLSELNGHLWPTLSSSEEVELYDLVLRIVREPDADRATALANGLPPDASRAFHRELSWFLEGPHQPGTPIES